VEASCARASQVKLSDGNAPSASRFPTTPPLKISSVPYVVVRVVLVASFSVIVYFRLLTGPFTPDAIYRWFGRLGPIRDEKKLSSSVKLPA
jgi:hypothetical protein